MTDLAKLRETALSFKKQQENLRGFVLTIDPEEILELINYVEKLEEALKWYADEDNYEKFIETYRTTVSSILEYETSRIDMDNGKRAKEALGQ